jgi:hypothetical protein
MHGAMWTNEQRRAAAAEGVAGPSVANSRQDGEFGVAADSRELLLFQARRLLMFRSLAIRRSTHDRR